LAEIQGMFSSFFSSPKPPPEYAEAEAALGAGQPQQAYTLLRAQLEYPAKPAHWKAGLTLLSKISQQLGCEPMATAASAAAQNLNQPQAWFDLGYQAIEQNLHALAANALLQADDLKPRDVYIIPELCVALEHLMLNQLAVDKLKSCQEEPLLRYLLAFHQIMRGQLAEAEQIVSSPRPNPDVQLDFMFTCLERILARARVLDDLLITQPLRAWHAALNACLLLHISPHGFPDPMAGRYAYVQDRYALCHEALVLLQTALPTKPATIWTLSDRNSRILATAAAQFLGAPLQDWRPDAGPGLVVVYDLDQCPAELWEHIGHRRAGQWLWVHASCWTDPPSVSPDITTFLYQANVAPWGEGRLQVSPESGRVEPQPEETSSEAELAQRILDGADDLESIGGAEALAKFVERFPLSSDECPRERQRVGSPILSARFG
jgi:hypothetical protein